jgi:hypothetical protein
VFRLAQQMGCTVRELRERMTVREFYEWEAFFRYQNYVAEQARKREEMRASIRPRGH